MRLAMTKRTLTSILVSAAVFLPAQFHGLATAAAAGDSLPGVDTILDKYVQATGGKAAYRKLTSRVIKGTIEGIPGMAALGWEMYAKAPNKTLSVVEITGFGSVTEGYDGRVAWANNPGMGAREKTGDELAKVKRESDFYREIKLKTIYPGLACTGKEKVNDEDAYVLEAKATASSQDKMYFSAKSGLMLRQDAEFDTPQGRVKTVVYPEDYRTVDGIKMPFSVRVNVTAPGQPEMTLTMKFSEIQHNVPIDDAKFAKPSA